MNAYVNLSNNVFTPEEHVLRCAAMIRRMLLRFDSFEHEVCPKKRSDCFTIIPPNRDLNCIQAQISPRTFNEKSHAWACPNELLFDNATKTCRPGERHTSHGIGEIRNQKYILLAQTGQKTFNIQVT